MATKIVCDVCGFGITDADKEPVDVGKVRLHLRAARFDKNDWVTADVCSSCLHGAAKAHDKNPPPEPGPYMGSLKYFVTLNGIRCPGPHAAFHCEADAATYLRAWGQGGDVRPA